MSDAMPACDLCRGGGYVEVTAGRTCPACGGRAVWRRGVHFDHEMRCTANGCEVTFEPGTAYAVRCPACGGTGAPPPLPEAMACVGCGRAFKVCACGDAADALQRAEDLAGIEEQIGHVSWLLAGGNETVEGQLPNGTEVTLRFPDDKEDVRMRVVNFIEETPAGDEDSTLTADSPLGLALYGHKAGDKITYQTPRGELKVTLRAIELP